MNYHYTCYQRAKFDGCGCWLIQIHQPEFVWQNIPYPSCPDSEIPSSFILSLDLAAAMGPVCGIKTALWLIRGQKVRDIAEGKALTNQISYQWSHDNSLKREEW